MPQVLSLAGMSLSSFALFLVSTGSALAQSSKERPANANEIEPQLEWFSGRKVRNGLMFSPYGLHTFDASYISKPNLVALSFESIIVGTFLNSYGDQAYFLTHGQNIFSYGKFGVDINYGVMFGYQGKLTSTEAFPDFAKPLFEGDINPVGAFLPYYSITDQLEWRAILTPTFVSIGLKLNFD